MNNTHSDNIHSNNSTVKLNILYEDDDIIIINKPAGLTVHKGAATTGTLLTDTLKAHKRHLSDIGGEDRPGIVHRLDRDTEGLMIIAKTNAAHIHLAEQFKSRTIIKKYYAMIKGDPKNDYFIIDKPIGRHPKIRIKRTVVSETSPQAKTAHTEVRVMKRFGTKTLVEVTPKTGRTHQIRVHLAYAGYPVLGDPYYSGKKKEKQLKIQQKLGKDLKGQQLQAFYLKFQHPRTGKWLEFKQPLSL
ncbi:RluA family pseudouridine synthase [Thermoproteota archaeon]